MSEPKDHHYIPVFYLSRWARADGRVRVFARRSGQVVGSWLMPKSTGYEPGLNSLVGASAENEQIIEKLFLSPVIDDQAAPALAFLVEGKGAGLTTHHVVRIVHFLLSFRVRHPAAIEMIKRAGEQVVLKELKLDPHEYAALRTDEDPEDLTGFMLKHAPLHLRNFGLLQLPKLITNRQFVARVGTMRWRVINCEAAKLDLVTGDRPVYLEGSILDGPCLIVFPASPTVLLVISTHAELLAAATQGNIKEVVKRANISCILGASERVFATGDQHVAAIEKHLNRGTLGDLRRSGAPEGFSS